MSEQKSDIRFQHIAVKSSTIRSVAFDAETETLQVRFHNGGLYNYQKVSPKTYHLFFTAESKGRYLNEFIKPNCPVTKIEEGKGEHIPDEETKEQLLKGEWEKESDESSASGEPVADD